MIKILFYAVNGLGIGHVTRLLAIARQVRKLRPDIELLFLTSSEADSIIYQEGFAAVKVPSKTIRTKTKLSKKTFNKLIQLVTWNVISAFSPSLMVVDTFPAGNLQELLPIMHWRPRMLFIYREQKRRRAEDNTFQSIISLYDRIIIPHFQSEVKLPLPAGTIPVYTGPILIRTRNETENRETIREQLNLPKDKLILYITFGGGGEQELDNALNSVLKVANKLSQLHIVIAQGPLCSNKYKNQPNITWLQSYYPICETFPAYDLAISSVGYNSANELLHFGIPSIYIPFERVLDDQFKRARRITEADAGLMLNPLTENGLEPLLEQLLDSTVRDRISKNALQLVKQNGAIKAAETIIELAEN